MVKRCWLTCAVIALALGPLTSATANPFEYEWHALTPAIWAAIRRDPFELPQEGNAVFVVTDRGVVVFDAGGSPAMGQAIVAKVRSVTDQPITHVVISHWHGDHMRGLQALRAAYPQAQIFAHPQARDFIVATQDKWLTRRVKMVPSIRRAVTEALNKQQDLSGRPLLPEERKWLENGLANTDQLDSENRSTTYVIPDSTFEERMTLYLGREEVQLLHLGRAHTAGDVVMWLPREGILATGDIVTGPIPLMPSAYTRDYVEVLNRIKRLGFRTLVPGHGALESDTQYVDLMIDLINSDAYPRCARSPAREGHRVYRLLCSGATLHAWRCVSDQPLQGLRRGWRTRVGGLSGRDQRRARGSLLRRGVLR
jgi:glyoxylase-like metal-dependent hydrolase (beta-lactamase superfamily II)